MIRLWVLDWESLGTLIRLGATEQEADGETRLPLLVSAQHLYGGLVSITGDIATARPLA